MQDQLHDQALNINQIKYNKINNYHLVSSATDYGERFFICGYIWKLKNMKLLYQKSLQFDCNVTSYLLFWKKQSYIEGYITLNQI